jgi:hypothetical protein
VEKKREQTRVQKTIDTTNANRSSHNHTAEETNDNTSSPTETHATAPAKKSSHKPTAMFARIAIVVKCRSGKKTTTTTTTMCARSHQHFTNAQWICGARSATRLHTLAHDGSVRKQCAANAHFLPPPHDGSCGVFGHRLGGADARRRNGQVSWWWW